MDLSILKNKIAKLPQVPGVYIFCDAKSKIIYIGKATNLKSRVGSYFRSYRGSDRPIEMMIAQVADIEVQETESVLEALILESNLIKKHQPKYNVKEKDDKSFSYFVITKEEFPRVLILRKTDLDKNPKSKLPMPNKIQNPKSKTTDKIIYTKIFGPYTSKKQMEIALKIMRKIFPFHAGKNKTEKGCLDFQLGRCPGPYAGAISKTDYAKNIRGIEMILQGKKKNLLTKMEKEMVALAKKEDFEKATELRNKIFALQHIQDIALINRDDNLKFEILNLKSNLNDKILKPVFRIEAYDISNISGQQAVGSMVVFENGKPAKKEYRKFKIKTVDGAADVAMMQEVLMRRLNNDWTQPDLILLDGGQGHVNMAVGLLNKLGFVIPIIGVAKGKTRKNLNFQFPSSAGGSNEFPMTKFSKEITTNIDEILEDKNLVKSIMDEAHRFAITYHRQVRKREFI